MRAKYEAEQAKIKEKELKDDLLDMADEKNIDSLKVSVDIGDKNLATTLNVVILFNSAINLEVHKI